jgi:hypothetical protein
MKKLLLTITMLATSGMLFGAAKEAVKFMVFNNTSEDFRLEIGTDSFGSSTTVQAGQKNQILSFNLKRFEHKPFVLEFLTRSRPSKVTRKFTVQPPKGGWLKADGDYGNEEILFVSRVESHPGITVDFESRQIERLPFTEGSPTGPEFETAD